MKYFWIGIGLLLISCGEKIFTGDVDCNNCYTEKPDFADLVIDLSINSKYPAVPVIIYTGDVEGNNVLITDTAYVSPYYAYVKVGRKYSVKAEYKSPEKTIYTVNGTRLKTLTVTDACDQSCYVIENEEIDARLKKDF